MGPPGLAALLRRVGRAEGRRGDRGPPRRPGGKGDILLYLALRAVSSYSHVMPRTARASVGGLCYHVLNRGNGRAKVFHHDADYDGFIDLLRQAVTRLPVRILGYALMPNHFHLVLWPRNDGDLSRWMQWLLTAHVRRYHRRYLGSGHVWQGRFKAFPIEADEHLWAVLRYVERNALRADLVRRAEDWRWSSLFWHGRRPDWLSDAPAERPRNWIALVNAAQRPAEEAALRRSINRGTPFGDETWTRRIARRLGLESTLRPRGRPRKADKKAAKTPSLFGEE